MKNLLLLISLFGFSTSLFSSAANDGGSNARRILSLPKFAEQMAIHWENVMNDTLDLMEKNKFNSAMCEQLKPQLQEAVDKLESIRRVLSQNFEAAASSSASQRVNQEPK